MWRSTLSRVLVLLAVLGMTIVGCDESPTSVKDFPVQPNVELSKSSLSLVLSGPESTTSFRVSYQGLIRSPTATGTGVLSVKKVKETGTPKNGSQKWSVGTSESVSGIVTESVIVRSPAKNKEIVDTLSVKVSPFVVSTRFSAGFAAIADYEDSQRARSASGGTEIKVVNGPMDGIPENTTNMPEGSNGVRFLEVNASESGSVTFERRASAPNSDRFTFLVKPNPSTDFNLTLTFTEETGGGEAEHQIQIPVNAGDQWLKYGIAFSQIGENFNPVATRAGGSGPLTSVELSADANVTYHLDELMLGSADATQVEIEDFERTTGAYGPPFCPPSFGYSDMVDAESDGFRARSVKGGGCFGYNYGGGLGPPALLFLDVTGSDVLSLRANASPGDSLYVFVETIDGDGDGTNDGGFSFSNGKTVALPVDSWGKVEIPLDSLGNNPSALKRPGIRNVGFEAAGEDPDFLIDDIKIKAPSGN